mgnify:CR=1 FL=1
MNFMSGIRSMVWQISWGHRTYEPVAMHPNNASNWNRSKVYVRMGFDEFLSIENWGDEFCDRVRKHYYSDATVYDKILRCMRIKKRIRSFLHSV